MDVTSLCCFRDVTTSTTFSLFSSKYDSFVEENCAETARKRPLDWYRGRNRLIRENGGCWCRAQGDYGSPRRERLQCRESFLWLARCRSGENWRRRSTESGQGETQLPNNSSRFVEESGQILRSPVPNYFLYLVTYIR